MTLPSFFAVRRLAAAVAFFALLGAAWPASAEIEENMNQCDGKLCAFFRASVTPPDGWVEDKAATRHFDAVILLLKDANSKDALKSAEPAYLAILGKY